MHFHPFLVGLCCRNNGAQCPNGVPPTPCSNSTLMTTECNSSYSQPSMRCYGTPVLAKISDTLAEQMHKNIIPSDLFCHLSNYRVASVRILKENLVLFFMNLWCQWVNWLQCLWTHSLSLSPGWRSPNTHPWNMWAKFGYTRNSIVAVKKSKRNIFISICTHPVFLLTLLCVFLYSFSHQIQSFQNGCHCFVWWNSMTQSWNVSVDKKKIAAGLYRLSAPHTE